MKWNRFASNRTRASAQQIFASILSRFSHIFASMMFPKCKICWIENEDLYGDLNWQSTAKRRENLSKSPKKNRNENQIKLKCRIRINQTPKSMAIFRSFSILENENFFALVCSFTCSLARVFIYIIFFLFDSVALDRTQIDRKHWFRWLHTHSTPRSFRLHSVPVCAWRAICSAGQAQSSHSFGAFVRWIRFSRHFIIAENWCDWIRQRQRWQHHITHSQ